MLKHTLLFLLTSFTAAAFAVEAEKIRVIRCIKADEQQGCTQWQECEGWKQGSDWKEGSCSKWSAMSKERQLKFPLHGLEVKKEIIIVGS